MLSSTINNGFFTSRDGLFLYHQRLAAYKWLWHGFTLRRNPIDGREMSFGLNGYQSHEAVMENRRTIVCAVCGSDFPLVLLKQIHSNAVFVAPSSGKFAKVPEGDALITRHPKVLIAVQTADCLPILLADTTTRTVAAVHAGWRGTLKQIARNALRFMQAEFGSRPRECVAVVGPSIRGCCYEVGAEVVEAFAKEFGYAAALFRQPPPHRATHKQTQLLDLAQACRQQLLDEGLFPENILTDGPCTSCQIDQFFSHRAEAGRTGRMLGVIGVSQGLAWDSSSGFR
jgi:YfiH family protein